MFGKKVIMVVEVEGMKCENCAKHVTEALQEIPTVKKVKVDLKEKSVTISSSESLEESIVKEKIESQGYRFLGVKSV